MGKYLLFSTIALFFTTSMALGDSHAVGTDDSLAYRTAMVGTREICTTRKLIAGVRTECRTEALPVERPSPLKGICITSYGNRTCY
jgi:hypothetical protein